MAWYIEAWDVFDGVAFATHWNAGDREPDEVVHLAAPDFAPVAVRDRATALWGTRGTFQEGFFEGDREVAFRSLDEVVETVRRAYLGGGVGFEPGGGPQPPPPGGGGGKSDDGVEPDDDGGPSPDHAVKRLVAFIAAERFEQGAIRPVVPSAALLREAETFWDEGHRAGRSLEQVFRLPLTLPHRPFVRTLADHVLAAACDRNYLRSIETRDELSPLLATALLSVGFGEVKTADERFDEAVDWLVRELGGHRLKGVPAAERALAEIPKLRGDYPAPPEAKPSEKTQ